ncbi:tRNA guanine26-N2-dimethyltransferase [Cinnamomum micranthum f. kanehirae]|uniref:tRNA (guanine(26)-N(2))-dimethyltransferase n=1 Tax=Cinnamomum micranthum f. kanehirae TaxID=337451 RepID=A0A3S3NAH5_9MAGN|nr:tRNA guanine26-N2-dimethyltransferase [Cinnamomum micranthum f. kanehirae]
MGDVEEKQQKLSKTLSTDPNDYTIIKEGDAEILMLANNEVFYNKTQVNNRDISIAVLRTFISKRKEEHAALLSKKEKVEHQVSEEGSSGPIPEEVISAHDEKPNGKCVVQMDPDEPVDILKESLKTLGGKVRRELNPPRILEALSASGLRALRYALSVEACKRNIKLNGSVACSKVESHLADARVYMLTHQKEFDVVSSTYSEAQLLSVTDLNQQPLAQLQSLVIKQGHGNKLEQQKAALVDLDPYGSPSVFLDSAVQSVADGGMLMCTATDLAVLCGGNGEVCYSKYGSYPLKGKYCHEMALRILLASIESHANRYKRYIVPVLSVQMDFYIRVFVRIFTSASAMKNTPLKLSYVYQCIGCDSFHLQCLGRTVTKNNSVRYAPGFGPVVPQECSDCGKKFNMGGPIWSAPIHDQEWVASILENVKSMKDRYPAYGRISAVLGTVSEELVDVPLFVSLHNLCATLKCTSPSAVMFRSAVINAGYRISGSHVSPLGMKTDAPMAAIWDIMRCWVKNHPVKAQPPEQSGSVILAKEPTLQANFARAFASLSKSQAKKVARFLPNPEPHWGPKVRAGRQITSKHVSLLGPQSINRCKSHEEGDEPDAKRPKMDDSTANS